MAVRNGRVIDIPFWSLLEPRRMVGWREGQAFGHAARKVRVGDEWPAKADGIAETGVDLRLGAGRIEVRIEDQRPFEGRTVLRGEGIEIADTEGSGERWLPKLQMRDADTGLPRLPR